MSFGSILQAWLLGAMRSVRQAPELADAKVAPCHVGVVFATTLEAMALENLLSGLISIRGNGFDAGQGGLHGRSVIVVRAGVGQASAARATATLIVGHRPRWVISAGLAGGLDPNLKRNDLVMPDAVVAEGGSRTEIALPTEVLAGGSRAVTGGSLLTVDRVISRVDEKQELYKRYGATCVDMETFGVAQACQRDGQPFFAVRVISDAADEELPGEVESLLRKKTLARRIGAAAGWTLRRPGVVKDLWHLKETALVCSNELARFLAELIARL